MCTVVPLAYFPKWSRNRHLINHDDACFYGAWQSKKPNSKNACKLTKKANSWKRHHACTTHIYISFYVVHTWHWPHACTRVNKRLMPFLLDRYVIHEKCMCWQQIKERHYSHTLCTWCHTVSDYHRCLRLGLGTRLGLESCLHLCTIPHSNNVVIM